MLKILKVNLDIFFYFYDFYLSPNKENENEKIKQKETKSTFLKFDNIIIKVLLFIKDYERELVIEVDIRKKRKVKKVIEFIKRTKKNIRRIKK